MELLQLKYFCDAAETENFSKSAKKFFVPTSSISQSIKRLEIELGCKLFDHKANKISLNNEGKLFYSNISKALDLIENGKNSLLDQQGQICGDIRLSCLSNRRRVTKAIEKFTQSYPNVNFIIHHTLDLDIDFDVIISDDCPCEYSQKLLLVDEEICVAMSKTNSLAEIEQLSIQDLKDERFITMTSGSSLHKITLKICANKGFVPDIAIQTDDPFYVRKYIEMGLGIAFVPTSSWDGLFPDNVILKKLNGLRRKSYAFLPQRSYNRRSIEEFLRILLENIDEKS